MQILFHILHFWLNLHACQRYKFYIWCTTYTHRCSYTQIYTYMYRHTQTHRCTGTHRYRYIQVHEHTHTEMQTLRHTQTHACLYINTHTHTDMQTLRHTQTHACLYINVTIENYHILKWVKLVQTSNTCVLLHCRICLYQVQYWVKRSIRINQEYHKNTIFNNFNRFIDITNKTGFITQKLDLYETRIYANFTIKPD